MSRSKWKFYFISKNVIRDFYSYKNQILSKKIKIFKKSNVFLNFLKKKKIAIHRGLYFKNFNQKNILIKKKIGSFVFTRKNFFFPKKKNKSLNK